MIKYILFDVGGTLINDPFPSAIASLESRCLERIVHLPLNEHDIKTFFDYWRNENWKIHFPFASHFLQEEIWPTQSFLRLMRDCKLNIIDRVPLLVLDLLKEYREHARDHIKKQEQLSIFKEILIWLKKINIITGVASNDREFATHAMMQWAGFDNLLDFIFVSESLSKNYSNAEKPSPEFFHAVLNELGIGPNDGSQIVYIGDSEQNDIISPTQFGIVTVRFFNINNPTASWLPSSSENTQANYSFKSILELKSILQSLVI